MEGEHLLVNENLYLAGCADLERRLYKLGNFLGLADIGLDDDSFGPTGLNLLGHLLCSLPAAV